MFPKKFTKVAAVVAATLALGLGAAAAGEKTAPATTGATAETAATLAGHEAEALRLMGLEKLRLHIKAIEWTPPGYFLRGITVRVG